MWMPSHEQAFWILCGATALFTGLSAWLGVLLYREAGLWVRMFRREASNAIKAERLNASMRREFQKLPKADQLRIVK
jgi:hypothetical protein